MFARAHVHIGMPKAGSSAIQRTAVRHAGKLIERGFLYPTSSGPSHQALNLHFRGSGDKTGELAALLNEIANGSNAADLVVSCEHLFSMPPTAISRMRGWIRDQAEGHTAICYMRSPEHQVLSLLQQQIFNGLRTLEEAGLGDYTGGLQKPFERWTAAFPRNELSVLAYVPFDANAGTRCRFGFLLPSVRGRWLTMVGRRARTLVYQCRRRSSKVG